MSIPGLDILKQKLAEAELAARLFRWQHVRAHDQLRRMAIVPGSEKALRCAVCGCEWGENEFEVHALLCTAAPSVFRGPGDADGDGPIRGNDI